MERPGKDLWDSPGSAAAPHGMLCNPSNAVASPVADNTSSFPNFSSPLGRADDRKCEPFQKAACHGGLCWREIQDKSLGKVGQGWRGSREGSGICSSFAPLMFQLLEGKDWDKTLQDLQGDTNPLIQKILGRWEMPECRQGQHSLLTLGQNQSLK